MADDLHLEGCIFGENAGNLFQGPIRFALYTIASTIEENAVSHPFAFGDQFVARVRSAGSNTEISEVILAIATASAHEEDERVEFRRRTYGSWKIPNFLFIDIDAGPLTLTPQRNMNRLAVRGELRCLTRIGRSVRAILPRVDGGRAFLRSR